MHQRLQAAGPIPQTQPHVAAVLESFHRMRRAALTHEIGRLKRLSRLSTDREL